MATGPRYEAARTNGHSTRTWQDLVVAEDHEGWLARSRARRRRRFGQRLPRPGVTLRAAGLQEVIQRLGEIVQLRKVGGGQVLYQPLTLFRKRHTNYAAVLVVLLTADDTGGLRAVNQTDGAVTLQ